MRISDWSSDVCSSDLLEVSLHPGVVVDTLAVLDVTGSSVRVQVSVGGSIVHDETRNVTEGGRTATTLVFSDLPRDASAELTVTLTGTGTRSEEHTSELQSLMRSSYAVICLIKTMIEYHDIEQYHQQDIIA